jgi:xylulokinase
MALLGVDIGTSGCKSAVYNLRGDCLSMASRSYKPVYPSPGQCELDSTEVLSAVLVTMKEAVFKSVENVEAVSFGSFSEAVVPVGANGEILGPSIAGSDDRCKEAVEPFKQMGQPSFYRINPNILSFTYTYPKLVWYKTQQKDLYNKIYKVLNWSDFLCYYLTGFAGTAYSHANRTMLFDLWKEDWSDELLGAGGLGRSIFPETIPEGTELGTIKPEIASDLGLDAGVKVVSGGHDQCMNALGAGAVSGGQSVTGMGTFECSTLVFDSIPDPELLLSLNLSIEHHVVPGKYVTLIYNQAGSLLDWFVRVFAADLSKGSVDKSAVLDQLAAEAGEGPSGILFLPTIEPTGAPYFKAGQTGTFHGINAAATRGDMYKALLEGESMYFLESIKALDDAGLPLKEVTATGGGSQSDLWLQIKANLLERKVIRSGISEAGTVGAAMLAGIAIGAFSGFDEAVNIFKKKETVFYPDNDTSKFYLDYINAYQELFKNYA